MAGLDTSYSVFAVTCVFTYSVSGVMGRKTCPSPYCTVTFRLSPLPLLIQLGHPTTLTPITTVPIGGISSLYLGTPTQKSGQRVHPRRTQNHPEVGVRIELTLAVYETAVLPLN